MPITIPLAKRMDSERVEKDLRKDFPQVMVWKGWFDSIKIKHRFDSLVYIKVRTGKVKIFATYPLWYALFHGGGSWGFGEDEKRHTEHVYVNWFKARYPDWVKQLVANSGEAGVMSRRLFYGRR